MRYEQAPMIQGSPGAVVYAYANGRVMAAVALVPGMRLRFRTKPKAMNQATPLFTGILRDVNHDGEFPYTIEYLRPGVGKVVERFKVDEFQELMKVGYNQGEANEFASILH